MVRKFKRTRRKLGGSLALNDPKAVLGQDALCKDTGECAHGLKCVKNENNQMRCTKVQGGRRRRKTKKRKSRRRKKSTKKKRRRRKKRSRRRRK